MTITRLLELPPEVLAMSDAELAAHLSPYFPSTRPADVGNVLVDTINAAPAAGSFSAAVAAAMSDAPVKRGIKLRT